MISTKGLTPLHFVPTDDVGFANRMGRECREQAAFWLTHANMVSPRFCGAHERALEQAAHYVSEVNYYELLAERPRTAFAVAVERLWKRFTS